MGIYHRVEGLKKGSDGVHTTRSLVTSPQNALMMRGKWETSPNCCRYKRLDGGGEQEPIASAG